MTEIRLTAEDAVAIDDAHWIAPSPVLRAAAAAALEEARRREAAADALAAKRRGGVRAARAHAEEMWLVWSHLDTWAVSREQHMWSLTTSCPYYGTELDVESEALAPLPAAAYHFAATLVREHGGIPHQLSRTAFHELAASVAA